jgi:hypothetical protein
MRRASGVGEHSGVSVSAGVADVADAAAGGNPIPKLRTRASAGSTCSTTLRIPTLFDEVETKL